MVRAFLAVVFGIMIFSSLGCEQQGRGSDQQMLIAQIEKLEGQLRDLKIGLNEFQLEFKKLELPTGAGAERVHSAESTGELRKALEDLKAEITPATTCRCVRCIAMVVLLMIALLALYVVCVTDRIGWSIS